MGQAGCGSRSVYAIVTDPGFQPLQRRSIIAARVRILPQLPESDPGQRAVLHRRRAFRQALMFDMALAAAPDVGMKCRRLTLQYRCVVGVAENALSRRGAYDGRVACLAVVLQMGVRLGETPRPYRGMPEVRGIGETMLVRGLPAIHEKAREHHARDEDDGRTGKQRAAFHSNHRMPK